MPDARAPYNLGPPRRHLRSPILTSSCSTRRPDTASAARATAARYAQPLAACDVVAAAAYQRPSLVCSEAVERAVSVEWRRLACAI
jgi:hypothetical protein